MTHPNTVEVGSLPSDNGSLRRFSTEIDRDIDESQLSPLNTFVSTASEHGISPRVSTVGTDDDLTGSKTIAQAKEYVAQDYSAPGLDSLHWEGVQKKGDFDQRSIASSMNAEKDDKSVYEVPLAYEDELTGAASHVGTTRESESVNIHGDGLDIIDDGVRGSMRVRPVCVRFDVEDGGVKVHMEDSSHELRKPSGSIIAASSACTSSGTSPRSLTPASPGWAAERFDSQTSQQEVGELSGEVVEEISLQVQGDATKEEVVVDSETVEESENEPAPNMMPKVDMGPEWESVFKGLVYEEGIDALGRPVVVLDADAIPPKMRSSAVTYVKTHLHPIVSAGDYVIVFTAKKASLPTFWIMGAYQALPRPFRKNVQYIILVRPSGFLRAILSFMRPFVSKKAGRKIKLVESLEEIGEATSGEVTMHHLGASFLEHDQESAS